MTGPICHDSPGTATLKLKLVNSWPMLYKSDYHYKLPEHLIAQVPLGSRTASRMLTLDGCTGELRDCYFVDLLDLLRSGDLLVLNNTRVISARLYGQKPTGGRVELLVERLLDERRILAHTRSSKAVKPGTVIEVAGGGTFECIERQAALAVFEFLGTEPLSDLLERVGHIPLPPYIQRPDGGEDRLRYQTVYAARPGAVAAPTAGLHFDEKMISQLGSRGISTAHVTLHVGSGTFQPVRVEKLSEHRMHSEFCEIDQSVVEMVNQTRSEGGRVIAVGTTTTRVLEAASLEGRLKPFRGETNLFITPGFRFSCVDGLLTNFHLPESTLLTLVCAFAGYKSVMSAYRHAVKEEYRFFSYGDAMFVKPLD